jgi:hypothetical protein
MLSWKRPAVAVACGLAVALTAAAAATAATLAATRTGTAVNVCTNPILDRDTTGWGPLDSGAAGARTPVAAHVVAKYAYVQPSSNGADPGMFLPQKDVAAGEQWEFAMDTWAYGPQAAVSANMQVDWYDSANTYLGWTAGPDVPFTAGTSEHWTRIAGDFTAPANAVRANVTAHLDAPAGMTWAATACDYKPVGGSLPTSTATPTPTATTPAPDLTTAAGKYGWGTPLPGSDEFNYGSTATPAVPDATKWWGPGDGADCWSGNNNNGRRCGANTRVIGGFLRMTGLTNGDTGVLDSATGQQYGRWEVRARSQAVGTNNGRQYHPVLIVWPDSDKWPDDGEYDYLENSSPGEQCAGAFMHYPTSTVQQQSAQKCGVDLTQWHNFAFEWTPQHVTGYIDGVQWFSFSETFQPHCIQCAPGPMHQTIQLDNFFGNNMQQATLDVDWARVYSIPGVSVPDES